MSTITENIRKRNNFMILTPFLLSPSIV